MTKVSILVSVATAAVAVVLYVFGHSVYVYEYPSVYANGKAILVFMCLFSAILSWLVHLRFMSVVDDLRAVYYAMRDWDERRLRSVLAKGVDRYTDEGPVASYDRLKDVAGVSDRNVKAPSHGLEVAQMH